MYAAVCFCGTIISWSRDRVRHSVGTVVAASAGGAVIYGLVLALPGLGNPLKDLVYSTALLQAGFLMFITVLVGLVGLVWGWIARSLLSGWLSRS
jgi:hypothetical protein